ncbi:MAG: MoaD/ThiS family protein [Verrucomicrobiota bacterium]
MTVRVLFFSLFRDTVGQEEVSVALEEAGASVSSLLSSLFGTYPDLRSWDEKMLIAVNCEYADRDQILSEGDEVALMPPVQGG